MITRGGLAHQIYSFLRIRALFQSFSENFRQIWGMADQKKKVMMVGGLETPQTEYHYDSYYHEKHAKPSETCKKF
jgi:hypothetical protein